MIDDAIWINLVSSVLLVMVMLHLDRYEQESIWPVARLFFVSVVATAVYARLKSAWLGSLTLTPWVEFYVEAALLEELLKFALLAYVVFVWKDVNESFDPLVYVAVIATGFAFWENVHYYVSYTRPGLEQLLALDDPTEYNFRLSQIAAARALPGHLLFDVTAAFFIGRSISRHRHGLVVDRRKLPGALLVSLGVAVLLHGTWNMAAAFALPWFVVYVFGLTVAAVLSILFTLRRSYFHRKHEEYARRIEAQLQLVRHGLVEAHELFRHREAVVGLLRRIQDSLAKVRLLGGAQQREVFEAFERHLAAPLTVRPYDGEDGVLAGLRAVAATLERHSDVELDWSYYFGVVVVLVMSGVFAAMIVFGIDSLIAQV